MNGMKLIQYKGQQYLELSIYDPKGGCEYEEGKYATVVLGDGAFTVNEYGVHLTPAGARALADKVPVLLETLSMTDAEIEEKYPRVNKETMQ